MSSRFLILAIAATTFCALPSCGQKVIIKQKVGAFTGKSIDLAATKTAWDRINSGSATDADRQRYNFAVDAFLVKLAGKRMPQLDDSTMTLRTFRSGPISVALDPQGKGDLDLRNHDQIYIAGYTKIKKGLDNGRATTDGIGAPLALRIPPNDDDPFIAPEGLWRPATAMLEFNGSANTANLVVYDPLAREKIQIGQTTRALESDYTVPLAVGLAKRKRQLINVPAMLKPDRFEDKLGLIRLTPFDPAKQPCLLVHGLKSSPATWKEALNKILDDPDLRERYEFWTYGYPTGAPIPYSAMRLRRDLARMREFRQNRGAETNDLVIIAHSMGGLISKTFVQSSGDENWFRVFKRPVDQLDVPDAEREMLRDMFYFEPVPGIKRIVFIATPHRGSTLATDSIGKITSKLINLPQHLINIANQLMAHADQDLTDEGRQYLIDLPTSIDTLRPDSEILKALEKMPMKPGVAYHSLIGQTEPDATPETATDEVVPVQSAQLDGVDSELVVCPSEHGVHRTEQGIAEILRILHLP